MEVADRLRVGRATALLFALALLAGTARAQERVPGRVLIRWRTPPAAPAPVLERLSARALRRVGRTELWSLAPGADLDAALAELARDPNVLYAEPDYLRRRLGAPVEPNDPRYADEWALPLIRAPEAWSRTTGSASVTVAVIDSGILPHPDLAGRIAPGYDFISDPANAGDGDGRDPDPTDPGDATLATSGLHGLHVAGILGAAANNGVGIAGLDWSCRIEPVRVLGVQGGSGVDSDIADAIRWAAGLHVDGVPDNPEPAQVINMSFGGAGLSRTMQDAVDDAIAQGVTVVAAAGNDGGEASQGSPAGLTGVIAVGAVDAAGQLTSYSDFGDAVALVAPGGLPAEGATGEQAGILSTMELPDVGYTYAYLAGTSQAAPFVSGAVALMKAIAPDLTPPRARAILSASADPSGRCQDPTDPSKPGCGAGLLDVDAALVLAATEAGQGVSPTSVGPAASDDVTYGGCSATGGRSSPGPGGLALVLFTLLAMRAGIRYTSRNAEDHV